MGSGLVLHIEDSEVERRIVGRLLQEAGFEVMSTGNPVEGIELARSKLPDVILVDLHLPDMDGFVTVEELRRIPGLESIPIVTLSASASERERLRCGDLFDAFIEKPVDLGLFCAQIRDLIEKGRKPGAAGKEAEPERSGGTRDCSPEVMELLEPLEKIRAVLSHDLRSPLTVIISYANTLSGGKTGELNDRQREMLDIVAEHGFKMDALISELLAVAREALERFDYPPGE